MSMPYRIPPAPPKTPRVVVVVTRPLDTSAEDMFRRQNPGR